MSKLKHQNFRHHIIYEDKNISGVIGSGNTITETIDNARSNLNILIYKIIYFEEMFVEHIRRDKVE